MLKRRLVERCESLEEHVLRKRLAAPAELDDYRPARGRASPVWDWVWWHSQLVRFCGRMESRELESGEADAQVLAALNDDPQRVALAGGGELHELHVYPKSLPALQHLQLRDQLLSWLAARYEALGEEPVAGDGTSSLRERVADEITTQTLTIAWIVTSEGPGLPFPADPADRPELPDAIRVLSPVDVLRIHQAFLEVNAVRLQALERLVSAPRGDAPSARPSWAVFVGALSMKLKADPKRLLADRSLASLLAQVKLSQPVIEEERALALVGGESD